jgi:predicted NBD/HSP70 family sugar kinase
MPQGRRGTVRDLRRENRAAVLWSLYFSRPGSRQGLSAVTGLSPASVTNVVRELLDEGIVTEVGSEDSDGGRPRVLLDINPDYGYVIGVDIGETRIRVELFDLAMTERAKAEYPLNPAEHEVDVVVRDIASGLTAVLADAGIEPAAVLGVGIGVPGIVQQGAEVRVHAQTYRWDAVPLERLLRAHTGLPLRFENGAKTMGQAELWFGAGRGARNAAVILIGSGVGASLISGGSTYRGATSSAAELGHTTIVVGGRPCRCGSAGCLEAYVGAEAILDRYGSPAALSAEDEESMLAGLIAAADSSPAAEAVLGETADYLGVGIGNMINLFNPDRVILGGWAGLLLGGRLLPGIRESARRHSLRHPFAATSIDVGQLGPEAVAFGAATLPMENFLNGAARPALPQPAGGELRPAIPGEHAFEVRR